VQGVFLIEFLPNNIPDHYKDTAESIRGYLVSIRGGAPFLSSTDGQILVEWLDASISPAIICTVIDRVALRRRKKRVKTRLTLHVCRGELNKIFKKKPSKKGTRSGTSTEKENSPFEQLKEKILAESLPLQVHPLRIEILQVLDEIYDVHQSHKNSFDLKKRKHDLEEAMQKAISVLVKIHEYIYEATINEHEELQVEAEIELSSLRSILPPIQWRDAVDEVIRDKLRQRFPSLRVGHFWDMINQM
jgi:hypothetical protein